MRGRFGWNANIRSVVNKIGVGDCVRRAHFYLDGFTLRISPVARVEHSRLVCLDDLAGRVVGCRGGTHSQ